MLQDLKRKLDKTNAEMEQRQVVKAKINPSEDNLSSGSSTMFQSIAITLLSTRDKIKSNIDPGEFKNIEIEIRLGMIIKGIRRWKSLNTACFPGTKEPIAFAVNEEAKRFYDISFDVGIDASHSERLKNIFTSEKYTTTETSEHLIRILPDKTRFEVVQGKPNKLLEEKSKLFRSDIALFAFHYDMRLDCCKETPLVGTLSSHLADNWDMERLKRRTSYISRDSKR